MKRLFCARRLGQEPVLARERKLVGYPGPHLEHNEAVAILGPSNNVSVLGVLEHAAFAMVSMDRGVVAGVRIGYSLHTHIICEPGGRCAVSIRFQCR